MQSFFHATINTFSPSQVICVSPGTTSHAYAHAVAQGKQWVEHELESFRWSCAAKRKFAVYASNTPGNAWLFATAQNPCATIRVYEVTPDIINPAPMAIVGYIGTKTMAFRHLARAISEYWTPQGNWGFLEYPAYRLTVIRQVAQPTAIALASAQCAYDNDLQQAQLLWP